MFLSQYKIGRTVAIDEQMIHLSKKDLDNLFGLKWSLDMAKQEKRKIIINTNGLEITEEMQKLFEEYDAQVEDSSKAPRMG
ncbi:hypothetical protein B1207_15160 [Legionella quinlivanii]|uniref:Uncharacterized protein n=1 Tax=Legionella quinlivanii TaxID=45073 RepID=A0A364LFB3_9GAMM|nr:hypothetical protein [Legionella quinlivanii]RAP34620.1 hypothetical protein B1207_15160 [Legionella quinlivanii]